MGIGGPRWFRSDSDNVFMSHNGLETATARKGTREAFRAAYEHGYRWMQVDAVCRGRTLVSQHALFGRPWPFGKAAKRRLAAAIELGELFADPALTGVRWNIEVKSATTTPALLHLLQAMTPAQRADVMISSPVRTSVLRAVAKRFPEVALAAPVWHGGVFGVRFLTPSLATIDGRPYDCQQVFHPFLRADRPPEGQAARRPLRQAWTIRSARSFFRGIEKAQSLTVDGDRFEVPFPDPRVLRTSGATRELPQVKALALGGGGWRSAFGAIGAIMYFWEQRVSPRSRDDSRAWDDIDQVVGISGGSFAVAGLAAEGPDDRDPTARLSALVAQLEAAGRSTATAVRDLVLGGAMALAVVSGLVVIGWRAHSVPVAVTVAALLAGTTFLARAVVSLRSRRIVHNVFPQQLMRAADPGGGTSRRYRIGATGLHDGDLYAFTTHPDLDGQRRAADEVARGRTELPAPLRHRLLADAVVRSTSLPGLGQLGRNRLYLCDHEPGQDHDQCPSVPDRLVDGGISGIFGRGLLEEAEGWPGSATMVVLDGGRKLVANHERTLGGRTRSGLERFSALFHLARWLMVAFEISYRGELARVADGQICNRFRCRLVRLSETELDPPSRPGEPAFCLTATRQRDLVRLTLLRERVHTFSLGDASPTNVNRGMAVAVAACALEFADEPDIPGLLGRIGEALGRGQGLVAEWDALPEIGAPSVAAAEDQTAA